MGILEGKSAVVTGAGRGLGQAFALAMAAEGASVLANDLDAAAAQTTADMIKAQGGRSSVSAANVADWNAARALIDQCAREFGKVDAVVANAGVTHHAMIWEETEEAFDETVSVNMKGVFNVARRALDYMIPARAGSLVLITSAAQSGYLGRSVYGGTKGAVASFTYTWALDLADKGVRVNAIAPTAQTRMSVRPIPPGQPVPHLRRPETIAPFIAYLASDLSMGVTGQVFRLDGDAIAVYSHPRPKPPATHVGGWTIDALRRHFDASIGRYLEHVGLDSAQPARKRP